MLIEIHIAVANGHKTPSVYCEAENTINYFSVSGFMFSGIIFGAGRAVWLLEHDRGWPRGGGGVQVRRPPAHPHPRRPAQRRPANVSSLAPAGRRLAQFN